MANLETLVVQEIWETETAAFWRRPGVDPNPSHRGDPAASGVLHGKKRNYQQLGRHGAMASRCREASGEAEPDGEIVDLVFRAVRDLIKDSKEPSNEIIRKAFWTYTTAEDILREINGYALRDNPETGLKAGDLVRKVSDLRSDGSTLSGAWIYAGGFANGETSRSVATRERIREVWVSIQASGGPGPTTCASSTTGHCATGTASPIPARNPLSGG